jgi:hypothetical protein
MATMTTQRERGGCLTVWLVLVLIANPLTAIYYLVSGQELLRQLPGFPGWALPVLAVAAAANFVFAIGMWMWKKWGIYGFIASAAVALVINIIAGLVVPGIISAIISIGILLFLVRDKWDEFE